jgi:hypothetical protein
LVMPFAPGRLRFAPAAAQARRSTDRASSLARIDPPLLTRTDPPSYCRSFLSLS